MIGIMCVSPMFGLLVVLSNVGRGSEIGLSKKCLTAKTHVLLQGLGPQRYTPPPGLGLERPRGGVHRKCCILQQFAYTPPNHPHQPFPYFF